MSRPESRPDMYINSDFVREFDESIQQNPVFSQETKKLSSVLVTLDKSQQWFDSLHTFLAKVWPAFYRVAAPLFVAWLVQVSTGTPMVETMSVASLMMLTALVLSGLARLFHRSLLRAAITQLLRLEEMTTDDCQRAEERQTARRSIIPFHRIVDDNPPTLC